jgi:hypothetical protein
MKDVLTFYLQRGRDALLYKLDGLGDYDVRRPMVQTGTNLLGLVKHVATVEAGYFGELWGRPFPETLPWAEDDAEPNADMWATVDESRDYIVDFYRRVWAHSDETIDAHELSDTVLVPWWAAERRNPTLHTLLVHMIGETNRHAGHADIIRELIDGSVGQRPGVDDFGYEFDWDAHRARLEQAAREAGGST